MNKFTENLPRAAAASILSAGLSAFPLANVFDPVSDKAVIVSFMLLFAIFTASLELTRLSAKVIALIAAMSAAAAAAVFILGRPWTIPFLIPLCAALCCTACLLNRVFAARCVIAAGLLSFMLVCAWLRIELLVLPTILLTAYPVLILCQVCGPVHPDGSKKQYDAWHVAFSLILSILVFSLPHAETRIRWEKLFDIRPSEQLSQLGDKLDIDRYETPGLGETGLSDDQSSLGGWLNLNSEEQLWLHFGSSPHPDRLCANIYDLYTGTGWECAVIPDGTGYYPDGVLPEISAVPAPDVSGSDTVSDADVSGTDVSGSDVSGSDDVPGTEPGRVRVIKYLAFSNENKSREEEIINRSRTLFYPPYTYRITENVRTYDGFGESAVRSGLHMEFPSAAPTDYVAYYSDSGECFPLTGRQRQACLSLPDSLPERVRELAVSMTDACVTDEEKAEAITEALSRFTYNTRAYTLPEGEDFVDWFLFENTKGYCQYFASAEAVLARCAGIPSRYVIGYHVPGSGLSVFLSNKNAHAWAELYIEGKGWTVYDPLFYEHDTSETDIQPEDEVSPEEIERERRAVNRVLGYAYIIIAAGVLLVLLTRMFFKRMMWFIRLRRKYRGHPQFAVLRRCGRLLWALASCGVRRDESETLREFSRRISEQCEWLPPGLLPGINSLLMRAEDAVYSSGPAEKPGRSGEPMRPLPAAVRFAFIRYAGLVSYIRIHRKYTPD